MASPVEHRLVAELEEAARGLIARSEHGAVSGDDVARAIGCDPRDAKIYEAFLEIERRGSLHLGSWGGAVHLPHAVHLRDAVSPPADA